jgi:hypothetical protein
MTITAKRIKAAVWVLLAAAIIPLWGAGKPATRPATTKPAPAKATATKPAVIAPRNPLLPPSVAVEGFYADLLLVAKLPAITPAGFDPLYTAADWQTFREKYGAEADGITKLKSSGQIAFAEKLIAAAENAPERSPVAPGLQRLLLTRAAAIAYRSKEGFPTADKAVQAYLKVIDKKSPAQLGALWSISNAMSRTSVTPRPDRIRYDGIAARANMQFSLLMLEADQIEAAQAMNKQIAYHEGWLKADKFTLSLIAQVRGEVKHRATMMEYLGTQYQPALRNDVAALTSIYLYGRYVKQNPGIVADLPGRVPDSSLAQLARKLDGAARGDAESAFAAAETLRVTAAAIPDSHIRARTLYAAMQLYDTYMAAPATDKNRVQRTLARINREAVVADGARRSNSIDPFAAPPAPATAPAPAVLGMAAH